MLRTGGLVVLLGLIAGFGRAAPATAAVPRVVDEAKFFSPQAVDKANHKLKAIQTEFGKEVVIDTFPVVPDDLQAKFKTLGSKEFFAQWARRRAKGAWIEGIYILMCKEPGHFEILVDKETRQKAFTLADRDRLQTKVLPMLREKKYDDALQETVDCIQASMRSNGAAKIRAEK